MWSNTDEEVTGYTVDLTNDLKKALGPDSNIEVYPTLGNHDTWPVNVEAFDAPNTNYEINHIRPHWTANHWLSEEEGELFAKWGYYSKPFKFNPKGRVLSLNLQACNDQNWWMFKQRTDPGDQIAWLEQQLSQIEAEDGFAYILSHIYSVDCLHQFGIRYKALSERYQHIIRFSSFGHTHNEQFRVNKAIKSEKAIGWQLLTGSGTTDGTKNPAFTVIDWDEEYMVPVNTHTYTFDLVEANKTPEQEPKWFELHDMLKEYGLKDLSPSSMKNLSERFYNDADLAS